MQNRLFGGLFLVVLGIAGCGGAPQQSTTVQASEAKSSGFVCDGNNVGAMIALTRYRTEEAIESRSEESMKRALKEAVQMGRACQSVHPIKAATKVAVALQNWPLVINLGSEARRGLPEDKELKSWLSTARKKMAESRPTGKPSAKPGNKPAEKATPAPCDPTVTSCK